MNEEEKKVIEEINKRLKNTPSGFNENYINDMKYLLNLIAKQQKEIEELKEDNKKKSIVIIEYQDLYEKLVDKIKAKIEEYDDKEMTVNLVNRSAGKTFQQAVRNEVRKVLQSLLEKE